MSCFSIFLESASLFCNFCAFLAWFLESRSCLMSEIVRILFCKDPCLLPGFDRISIFVDHWCMLHMLYTVISFHFLRCPFILAWPVWFFIILSLSSIRSSHHLVAVFCFCYLFFLSMLWSCLSEECPLIIWSWKGFGAPPRQTHNHHWFVISGRFRFLMMIAKL